MAARSDAGDSTTPYDLTVDPSFECRCADGTVLACTSKCSGIAPRRYVGVTVENDFTTLFPYPMISKSFTLSESAEMRAR